MVTFSIAKQVPARQLVDVTIPQSYGVIVPKQGIEANQASFRIATNVPSAPVLWRPILTVPLVSPVGSFGLSEIDFTVPHAGNITGVHVRFRVDGAVLFPDDEVVVKLPDFTGSAFELHATDMSLANPADAVKSVVWAPASFELRL